MDKKNGKITCIEGSGLRYSYTYHRDEYDSKGAINSGNIVSSKNNRIKTYLTREKIPERICLIRIITDGKSYIDSNNKVVTYNGITNSAKSRVNFPNIDIEKIVKISNGSKVDSQYVMADLNDSITYEITIKNNSNKAYSSFNVVEDIDSNLTVTANGGGTLSKNQLKWQINALNPGESKKISYTVKVPEKTSLYGKIIISTGKVDNIATTKIETIIGDKFNESEKTKILNSFNKLKNTSKTEREFLNDVYLDAFNVNLGVTGLDNLEVMCFDNNLTNSGGNTLAVKYTKLNNTSVNKYIFQNFYGLRVAQYTNAKKSLVRAAWQWDYYPTIEFNDRARILTEDMLVDGDIILAYTGEKDDNLANKAYIYLQNKLIRKISSSKFEEITGEKLKEFLQNIVGDNYVLLRPSLGMNSTTTNETSNVDKNCSVNGVYYKTLAEAYKAITGTSGTIKIEKSYTDNSKLEVAQEKEITININGKTITKKSNGITNRGILNITGNGTITTKTDGTNTIRMLITNTGTLNILNGTIVNAGITTDNSYTIYTVIGGIMNIKGGTIKSTLAKDSTYFDSALNVKGTVNITGGTIQGTTYGIFSNNSGAKIYISGGTITSNSNVIIVTGEKPKTSITITGGTLKSKNDIAILNNGTGATTIGKKGGETSITKPIIQGGKSAIFVKNGFAYYDGILKGKDKIYSGTLTVETNYKLKNGTEVIDGKTYKTAILEKEVKEENPVKPVTYKITFNANGGTGTMSAQEVQAGNYVLPKNSFTAPSGKEFEKWDKGNPGATIKITGNLVITANWKNKATVDTGKDNTNVDKIKPQISVKYSTTQKTNQNVVVTITANEAIKSVSGWTLSKDSKVLTKTYTKNSTEEIKIYDLAGNMHTQTIKISNIEKEENLVKPVTYKITFNANGGTGTMSAQEVQAGNYILPKNNFTAPSGKEFEKWDKGSPGATIKITGDVVITANWKTISTGGGSGSGGGSLNEDDKSSKYKITTEASAGGKITPSNPYVEKNTEQEFIIKANKGYEITDVIVDGKSVGKVERYKFENVTSKHKLEAKFNKITEKPANKFNDVKETDWYYENVNYVVENGLFSGVSDIEFAPNNKLTRGMLVTVLYRLSGVKTTAKAQFEDVGSDKYYSIPIAWASKKGIVNGVGENKFAPDANITRQDLVTILYRYAKSKGVNVKVDKEINTSIYEDSGYIADYALEAIKWGCGKELIKGRTSTTLAPLGNATRAETAVLIQRLSTLMK